MKINKILKVNGSGDLVACGATVPKWLLSDGRNEDIYIGDSDCAGRIFWFPLNSLEEVPQFLRENVIIHFSLVTPIGFDASADMKHTAPVTAFYTQDFLWSQAKRAFSYDIITFLDICQNSLGKVSTVTHNTVQKTIHYENFSWKFLYSAKYVFKCYEFKNNTKGSGT